MGDLFMKKAFVLLAIVFVIFFSSFASAHFFQNAVKWIGKNVDSAYIYQSNGNYSAGINFNSRNCCGHYGSNYYTVNSYSSTPRNSYYVPPQQNNYGYGTGTYFPRGTYYVYSGTGYGYSGPVVVYD